MECKSAGLSANKICATRLQKMKKDVIIMCPSSSCVCSTNIIYYTRTVGLYSVYTRKLGEN